MLATAVLNKTWEILSPFAYFNMKTVDVCQRLIGVLLENKSACRICFSTKFWRELDFSFAQNGKSEVRIRYKFILPEFTKKAAVRERKNWSGLILWNEASERPCSWKVQTLPCEILNTVSSEVDEVAKSGYAPPPPIPQHYRNYPSILQRGREGRGKVTTENESSKKGKITRNLFYLMSKKLLKFAMCGLNI